MDRESLADGVDRTTMELRMQLEQVTAASQLLEQAWDTARAQDYLSIINQSVCRMLRVIERLELMHLLTDEAGPAFTAVPTDLGPFTEALCDKVESVLAMGGIRFDWTAPEHLLARVDEALLTHMLLELICNSAKAGKEVTLTLTQRGGKACFSIKDDGPGAAPEELARMFDAGIGPVGRGIPLAQRIAELHSGSLMANNVPGKGLTMMAVLPIASGSWQTLLESPRAPAPQSGFDEVLVTLSELLPAAAFSPENL